MLVDASQHAGPALWQGIMLIALVPYVMAITKLEHKHFGLVTSIYIGFGVVLMAAILML